MTTGMERRFVPERKTHQVTRQNNVRSLLRHHDQNAAKRPTCLMRRKTLSYLPRGSTSSTPRMRRITPATREADKGIAWTPHPIVSESSAIRI
jgi:hypothetical protein